MDANRAQGLVVAANLIDMRRYEDARRILLDILADDGSNANAISLLALVATNTNDHSTAVETIFRAVALAPESATIRWRAGVILLRAKRTREAQNMLEEAVRLGPSAAGPRVDLARAVHTLGDTNAAFPHLRAALQIDPNFGEAWNLRAVLLAVVGLHEEAKEAAREALRLAPEGSRAHMADGLSAIQLGQLGRARKALRESLRINPADATSAALYTYAAMYSLPLFSWFMATPATERLMNARILAVAVGVIVFCVAIGLTENSITAVVAAYLLAPIIGETCAAIAVISISTDPLARNGLRPLQLPTAFWLVANLSIALIVIVLGRSFHDATFSAIGVVCGYSATALAFFRRKWLVEIMYPIIPAVARAGLILTAITQLASLACIVAASSAHPMHVIDVWFSTSSAPLEDRIASRILDALTTIEALFFTAFFTALVTSSSIQSKNLRKARTSAHV